MVAAPLDRVTILDRYIFREFALALAGVIGFCSLLIIVGMIFENFQDMIDNKTPLDSGVWLLRPLTA